MYAGKWDKGLKHGSGTYTWKDGSCWEGTFKNDELHGYGMWFRCVCYLNLLLLSRNEITRGAQDDEGAAESVHVPSRQARLLDGRYGRHLEVGRGSWTNVAVVSDVCEGLQLELKLTRSSQWQRGIVLSAPDGVEAPRRAIKLDCTAGDVVVVDMSVTEFRLLPDNDVAVHAHVTLIDDALLSSLPAFKCLETADLPFTTDAAGALVPQNNQST
jgi:hypothetical protein